MVCLNGRHYVVLLCSHWAIFTDLSFPNYLVHQTQYAVSISKGRHSICQVIIMHHLAKGIPIIINMKVSFPGLMVYG